MKEFFEITSISRDDLEALGFDTSEVSDSTMELLAKKMADDYLDQLYWTSMKILASDYFDIPMKETKENDTTETIQQSASE